MRRKHIKIDKMGETWYIRLAGKNGKVVHFPAKGVRDVVTYGDMFTYTLVLIGLASLIVSIRKHKK